MTWEVKPRAEREATIDTTGHYQWDGEFNPGEQDAIIDSAWIHNGPRKVCLMLIVLLPDTHCRFTAYVPTDSALADQIIKVLLPDVSEKGGSVETESDIYRRGSKREKKDRVPQLDERRVRVRISAEDEPTYDANGDSNGTRQRPRLAWVLECTESVPF